MFSSLPPCPEPQMTYVQDAVWSHFQTRASAAYTPPWALPGAGGGGGAGGCRQLGARWTGPRKSGVLHILTPAPTLAHTQPVRMCRGIHTCAEMGIQMLVPDASPAVCTCIGEGGLKEPRQQCPTQPFPSCPRCSVWGWRSRPGQGAPHPPPSLGQCQLERGIEDPTVAASGHPKGCQWVSVPSLP